MSTEHNKAMVRRYFEEVLNQGHLALAEELNAPNWVYHDPAVPDVRTLAEYTQWFTEVRKAFPDFQVTIEDLVAEGDQVVVRYSWRGTNTGAITRPVPLPATGRQVAASGMSLVRFVGGKGVEVWNEADSLGLFQQLGLIPAPEQAS